ncbi:polysaccharide biosynthesis protein [Alphaproteobacteria bacterium]|nr:polysaccharide biosynthesis protein [Alphaproteobacteria bacterium]
MTLNKYSANSLAGKRVLITGACGTVGSELVKKLLNLQSIVCAFDNDENGLFALESQYEREKHDLRLFAGDIRDISRLIQAFKGVDVVFHCAAMKHVAITEYNPDEAIKTNINGVSNVITAALDCGVSRVLFTSSDKAVNPSGTMGVSKLLGEKLITAANNHVGVLSTRFASVRFGNILNSRGSVVEIFRKQIENGKPLTITSKKMTRFVLTKAESVDLCISALEHMQGGEIFIQSMNALSIENLGSALVEKFQKIEWSIIGCKPGEKLHEELATELEQDRVYLSRGMIVVLPEIIDYLPLDTIENIKRIKSGPKLVEPVRSDAAVLISIEAIRSLLKDSC